MADEEKSSKAAALELVDLLYAEPLRPSTRRAGVLLSAFGVAAITAIVFDLEIRSIPIFNVELSGNREQFQMLCMIVVAGLLIEFLPRAYLEILHKRELDLVIESQLEAARLKLLVASAREIDNQEGRPDEDDGGWEDPWWQSVGEAQEESRKKLSELENRIGGRVSPLRLRNFRFWTSVSYPVVLAGLSLWLGSNLFSSFFSSLLAKL